MVFQYHYDKFPPTNLDWAKLVPFIGPAQAALARYDGILKAVPNAQVLLSPLIFQEAVLSSRIEGTQATLGEVLRVEAGDDEPDLTPDKRDDVQEVLNYRSAMWQSVQDLENLPLSSRLLCNAHKILLQGVRGRNRSPGEFRRIQNWIGPSGCPQEQARFIPIAPQQLAEGMGKWNEFINDKDFPDQLVQLAIVHAEFESLHPFLDGNGRLGRLIVPLFLFEKKLLSSPSFYMSAYLEANRDTYYNQLLNISATGEWTNWCNFFLNALRLQAEENGIKAEAILGLYEQLKKEVLEQLNSQYAIQALDFIFQMPIFKSTDFIQRANIPDSSAKRILRLLRDRPELLLVLREGSGRKPAILGFGPLLNIVEDDFVV
ncbi:Fic/DOC family N-terminal domain-containing protein [Leptothoe sp. LEGE 181152]|nr:Fic/DOC family N-terminal domain-containing protein [Leptothoe sp. LEGE 181152]